MYQIRLCFISLLLVICCIPAAAQKKLEINVQLTADKVQYNLGNTRVIMRSGPNLGGTADTLQTNKQGFVSDSIAVNQFGRGNLIASIRTCDNRPRADSQFIVVDTISPDTFRLNACPREQLQVSGKLTSDDPNYRLNNRQVVVKQFLSGQVKTDTLTTDAQSNFGTTFQVPPSSRDSVRATITTCNGNPITRGKLVNVSNNKQVNFTLNACPRETLTVKGNLVSDDSNYRLSNRQVVVKQQLSGQVQADTLITDTLSHFRTTFKVLPSSRDSVKVTVTSCNGNLITKGKQVDVSNNNQVNFTLNACPKETLVVQGNLTSDDPTYRLSNRQVVVKQQLSGQVQADTLITDTLSRFRTTFQVRPSYRDSVKVTVTTCNGNPLTKGKQVDVTNTNQVNFTLNACPKASLTIRGRLTSDDPHYELDSIAVTIEEKFSSTGQVTTVLTDSGGGFRRTIAVPASTTDTVQASVITCNGDRVVQSRLVNADSGLQSPITLNACPRLSSITLSGSVATKQGRIRNASVRVFEKRQAGSGQPKLKLEDSTYVDSSGNYKFEGLNPGTYFLRAKMPTEVADTMGYMPTYFRNNRQIPGAGIWPNADSITLNTRDVYEQRINMHRATKINGPGFITGYVHERNNMGEQKPANDALVVLLDTDDDPVAFQFSDSLGFYEFPNVELGTYQVRVEIPGLPSEKGQVTLTEDDLSASHIYFNIQPDRVSIDEQISVSRESQKPLIIKLYPNPVQDQLNLSLSLEGSSEATLSIRSMRGKTMYRQALPTQQGKINRTIPMHAYPDGVYLLKLSRGDKVITRKIIKK